MDTIIAIEDPAPNFRLPDLQGEEHSLLDYRGKVVVINFWSAECPHVERTDKQLVKSLDEWGEDVALLPVASNANESLDLLRKTAEKRGLPLVLHDFGQQVADLYGAVTTPHVFVLDGEGLVRYQGAFDDVTFRQRTPSQAYVLRAVEAVLAGREPQPVQTRPYGCSIMRFSPDEGENE